MLSLSSRAEENVVPFVTTQCASRCVAGVRTLEAAVARIASSSTSHRLIVANMVPASLVLLTFLCLALRLSSNYLMASVSSPMVSPMLNYVTKTLELCVGVCNFTVQRFCVVASPHLLHPRFLCFYLVAAFRAISQI